MTRDYTFFNLVGSRDSSATGASWQRRFFSRGRYRWVLPVERLDDLTFVEILLFCWSLFHDRSHYWRCLCISLHWKLCAKSLRWEKQRPPAFLHSFRNLKITELRRDGAALRYFDAEFTSWPYVLSFLKAWSERSLDMTQLVIPEMNWTTGIAKASEQAPDAKKISHFTWKESLFWQAVCKSLVTSPGACKDRGLELGRG